MLIWQFRKNGVFYEALPHAAGSLLPFASANGYLNAPALPPVFYIRRLKTDGKREPAAQGVAL